MEYIWIWMLVVLDTIWLISSIVDVIHAVRYVKNNYNYDYISEFIKRVVDELNETTTGFVIVHVIVLFFVSFAVWKIKVKG